MPSAKLQSKHNLNTIFPSLLVGYEAVNYLSVDTYLPAMPTIKNEFAVNNQTMQWTLTILFLGNIVAQLITGKLSEKYGRKTIASICGKIVGITAPLGLLLNILCPYQILAIILFVLPLMFSLGLDYSIFNRLVVESNNFSLDLNVVLFSFCTNRSAFLTCLLVSTFISQSIFRFSVFLFMLSFKRPITLAQK